MCEYLHYAELTVEDIKHKINNVRSQMSDELKKIKMYERSGQG